MKTILLTFDIEEFPAKEFNIPINKDEAYKLGYEGTKKILNIVKKNKIKITCFVTYEFAKKYKRIVKELQDLGCEIASHGFNHNHRYNKMSEKEAFSNLKKSLDGMKKLGFNVKGFRAPQMSKPKYEIIEKVGFIYDSSLHPAWIPGYYNNLSETRKITIKGKNLKEIPLSVAPIVRFPMAWLWFRNFGLFYEKLLTKINFLDMNFTHIYIHPWELIDIDNKINKKYMSKLILRKTGDEFIKIIEEYINWCKNKKYEFNTISGFLKK